MARNKYTIEQQEFMVDKWEQGWSASQIANEFASKFNTVITRNSVIGWINRNGYQRNTSKSKSKHVPKLKPKKSKNVNPRGHGKKKLAKGERVKPRKEKAPPKDAPPSKQLGVLDLTETTCRWPYGDPRKKGFGFCGRYADPKEPYCAFHMQYKRRTEEYYNEDIS